MSPTLAHLDSSPLSGPGLGFLHLLHLHPSSPLPLLCVAILTAWQVEEESGGSVDPAGVSSSPPALLKVKVPATSLSDKTLCLCTRTTSSGADRAKTENVILVSGADRRDPKLTSSQAAGSKAARSRILLLSRL